MKNLLLLLSFAALAGCGSNRVNTEALQQAEMPKKPEATAGIPIGEKERFNGYMKDSYLNLEKAVSGLNETQLNWKASPGKWSVKETLEHIVLTEPMLLEYLKGLMAQPANPEKRAEIKTTDDGVITGILDRSKKAQAPEQLIPSGKFADVKTALAELKNNRKAINAYFESTSLKDLRNHVFESPGGVADGYQFLLYIPGHTMRHTLQIQEIKADPNFPK